jgi:hypothetical protein
MSAHHRQMIRYSMERLQFLEEQIVKLDSDIAAKIRAAQLGPQWQLLQTVPAISGNLRGGDSGRDRWRYDDVSVGQTSQLLGWTLPWKQSLCWQQQEQSYDWRQSLVAQLARGMLLGGDRQTKLLLEG